MSLRNWNPLRWRARDASMAAEMRHHIEMETEARIAAGLSPDEARRTAIRDFGGVDHHAEAARDQRRLRWLSDVVRDALHAARVLARNPAYAVATSLTLALGIGCATSIYSVVHAVLLRPLPYERPNELAVVWETNPSSRIDQNVASVGTFEALTSHSRSFASLAALVPQPFTIGGADPERVMGADVSPGYFRLLGASAAIGRVFDAADTVGGAAEVVVLSDALWRRRFGGDSSIVGQKILLDQRPFVVVGVMPGEFDPPKFGWLPDHEFWTPWIATASNRTWGRYLLVLGRLHSGVTVNAARAELIAIGANLARADARLANWSMDVVPLDAQITGDVRRPLLLLLGAVLLLFSLAGTNVGGLVLGFMRRRRGEHALRRALGATSGRLLRELVTHVVVIGMIGCAGGIALASLGTRVLTVLLPSGVPRAASIALDGPVLAAGIAAGILGSLVCAVYSAAIATRELASATRSGGARATAHHGRGSLVVAEIALSVVLAILAGLMLRSFTKLRNEPLGFDASHVVTARISLPGANYGMPDQQRAFFDRFGAKLRGIPGVTAAGFVTSRPLVCCAPSTGAVNPNEPARESGTVSIRYADSSYFAALKIPVLAGRGFSDAERPDGPPNVLVDQRLAAVLYAGSAVGQPITIDLGDPVTNKPVEGRITGVVADVHLVDARTKPEATAYLATARFPSTVRDVVIRSDAGPGSTLATARRVLHDLDPGLPLAMAGTLDESVGRSMARDRFITLLLSAFAVVSLLLAAVGIYGMFAAEVMDRRKEIGIRLALGATGRTIVATLVGRAALLAATGAAIGCVVGLGVSRFMTSLLFDVAPSDPWSFASVSVLLVAVATTATLVPCVDAALTSPLEATRAD